MKNPLTFTIESRLGAIFVLLFSAFLIGLLLVAIKNFNSDTEVLATSGTKLRTISVREKSLIDQWLQDNNIEVDVRETGYRDVIKKYPNRPWLTK